MAETILPVVQFWTTFNRYGWKDEVVGVVRSTDHMHFDTKGRRLDKKRCKGYFTSEAAAQNALAGARELEQILAEPIIEMTNALNKARAARDTQIRDYWSKFHAPEEFN